MIKPVCISLILVSFVIDQGKCEVFSAISHLDTLLQTEIYTVEILERFLQAEQRRIENLKESINMYRTAINSGIQIGTDNPVHSYIVMKNISKEWNNIKTWSNANTKQIFSNISLWRNQQGAVIPSEEDLKGSRVGILRLQDTYDLKPSDLAEGKVKGVSETTLKLDADDCFQLGVLLAIEKDYYNTLLWMEEAKKRLDKNIDYQNKQLKADIYEYYSFALYKQDNLERAMASTIELLNIEPDNPRFKNNVEFYKKALGDKYFNYTACQSTVLPPMKNNKPQKKHDKITMVYEKYKSLCRGEFSIEPKKKSKLHCFYKKDRPFLLLAPIKVELVHTKPDIYLFKNILSNEEIKIIENITKPRLRRAAVSAGYGKKCKVSTARTAKNAWIKNHEHGLMSVITKRVSDMTNLNAYAAEDLQVVNYGIGGHYHLHYDFLQKNLTAVTDTVMNYQSNYPNDRIATVLFYMSSPTAGGATVFSELNLTLYPTKNDALFWFNLLQNGMPDLLTKHSGCPVLAGSKWVANKWIRERNQEFERPCDIDETK